MTQVLDHGYVKGVEFWGKGEIAKMHDDEFTAAFDYECGIIEAARMSTSGAFRGWDKKTCSVCGVSEDLVIQLEADTPCTGDGAHKWTTDEKLLGFLFNAEPQHATPFEFAGMIIEIQCPLFVRSEWHRHRTQGYNEMSARYAPLPDLNYMPTVERLMLGGGHLGNKQAGSIAGASALTEAEAIVFQGHLEHTYKQFEVNYQEALKRGVPKELARIGMPVGRYTRFRAVANLRNWLAFALLRDDKGAQWEIQQYAGIVVDIIRQAFPRVHKLFQAKRAKYSGMKTADQRLQAGLEEIARIKERTSGLIPGEINDILNALQGGHA